MGGFVPPPEQSGLGKWILFMLPDSIPKRISGVSVHQYTWRIFFKMYCTHCGTELPEQAKFCNECGTQTVQVRSEKPEKAKTKADQDEKNIPEEIGKIDKKAPPKIAPVTLLFAVVGIILIIILLHPWHANQDRPTDFEGSRQQMETIISDEFPLLQ
ncbi:MAG: zinc-ribbon domain-containing protein [Candidatus Marinimicrobia bacterium]|nr:zinc-ribbon domain-containing protein [Candidatus Neomarinimicrobiota bacterium]